MIPTNRPVTGADIIDLKERFDLSQLDLMFLVGAHPPNFSKMTSQTSQNEPLGDIARAILVRLLDLYPDLLFIPEFPEASKVFELVNEVQPLPVSRHGPLVGRQKGSGYRWATGKPTTPVIDRLLLVLYNLLTRAPTERARQTALEEYIHVVETEAGARGISRSELWVKGSWNQREDSEE